MKKPGIKVQSAEARELLARCRRARWMKTSMLQIPEKIVRKGPGNRPRIISPVMTAMATRP